jgi:hypothetical protein
VLCSLNWCRDQDSYVRFKVERDVVTRKLADVFQLYLSICRYYYLKFSLPLFIMAEQHIIEAVKGLR